MPVANSVTRGDGFSHVSGSPESDSEVTKADCGKLFFRKKLPQPLRFIRHHHWDTVEVVVITYYWDFWLPFLPTRAKSTGFISGTAVV